jgi:hypothetical protein
VRYLKPGEVIAPEKTREIRIYVLGPPQDEKLLHKTGGPSELYHLGRPDLDEAAKHAAARPTDELPRDPYQPFESVYTYIIRWPMSPPAGKTRDRSRSSSPADTMGRKTQLQRPTPNGAASIMTGCPLPRSWHSH